MSLLVIFECRDSNATQDVTWIEQLATKAEAVSADRVVAVSSTGFSPGAEKLAAIKGIELCPIVSVSKDDVASWIRLTEVTIAKRNVALAGMYLDYCDDTPPFTPTTASALAGTGEDLISCRPDGSQLSGRELVGLFQSEIDWRQDDQANQHTPHRIRVLASGEPPSLGPGTEAGPFPLARVVLEFEHAVEKAKYPISRLRRLPVGNDTFVEMVEADVMIEGAEGIVGFWRDPEGNVHAAVKPSRDITASFLVELDDPGPEGVPPS